MRRQVACYLSAACIATLMSLPGSAQALLVPIPGLFGTGLDDDGNVQANGAKEKHYAFHGNGSVPFTVDLLGNIIPLSSLKTRIFTQPNAGTEPSWSGNSSTSAWIGPDNPDPLLQPVGLYTYTTTFKLSPDLDPASASITAYVFGDDGITQVFLNGIATGLQNVVPGTQQSPFQVPWRFDIDSGFQKGTNTLDWVVPNTGGPTGLRVQIVSEVDQGLVFTSQAAAADVPEPSSIDLTVVGLIGLVWVRARLFRTVR
jgi:hypothetical protein